MQEKQQYNINHVWSSLLHTPECLAKHREFRFRDEIKDIFMRKMGLKVPSTLVEIGCGSGTLAYKLWNWYKDLRIVAFDQDKGFIDYARTHYKGPIYTLDDAKNLTISDKFDYVLSHTIMEYMNEEVFFECNKKLLKPMGEMIVVSNVKSLYFDDILMFPQISDLTKFYLYCQQESNDVIISEVLQRQCTNYADYIDKFKRNGFEIVRQDYLACETIVHNYPKEKVNKIIDMYREIQISKFCTAWHRKEPVSAEFSYRQILEQINDYYNKIDGKVLARWPANVDILRITKAKKVSAHSNV